MSDQREAFGRRRKSADPQSRKAERNASGPGGDSASSSDLRLAADEKAIKAVSGLLSLKKEVLAGSAPRPKVALPDLSGPLGELARQMGNPQDVRTQHDELQTRLDTPLVNFPDGSESDRATSTEAQSAQSISAESGHAVAAYSGPGSLIPEAGKASSRLADPSEAEPGSLRSSHSVPEDRVSGSNLSVTLTHSIERTGALGPSSHVGNSEADEVGSFNHGECRTDSLRSEGLSHSSRPAASLALPELSSLERLREPGYAANNGDPRSSVSTDGSKLAAAIPWIDGSRMARPSEPAENLVRNPLSAELRNFSMTGLAGSESNGSDPSPDGPAMSPVDASIGSSAPGSESGSIDLSRTNELLQQLVDAVRKQRNSSLSVGGPLVYADR